MGDQRHRFVVGVDYGTTYSGVAYLHTKTPDYKGINVIQTWPGKGGDSDNRRLDKAPTEISFEDGDNLWGYQLAPGAKRYGCFKLLLDAKTGKTKHDDPNLASAIDAGNPNALLALPPGKDVNEVTFEYLKLLYEHIIQQLRKRSQVTFDSTPIQFVLTTPAIWSHLAQDATCKAAIRAGFTSRPGDTITMVAEPEAAALYCLKELHAAREGSENPLQKGDRVLVCDAGGGTVDLATYTITQTSPSLRVKEANVGSGGKCGSTTIDRAFLKLVESRIGPRFKKWPAKKTGRGSSLMTAFETAKKGFGTSSYDQTWHVPVGNVDDDPENGIEEGEMKITSKDMATIFDPVVKQIVDLVASQIKGVHSLDQRTKVMTILLVGGFGESQYLFNKLNEWCGAQPFAVDVINPTYSWSAVVRGAVIHGIETKGIVEARKLKRHYGVVLGTPFDPSIHEEEDSFFDIFTMMKMTMDNVEWLAGKGEDAENERRIPIPCFGTFREWGGKKLEFDLTGCDNDDAPKSPKGEEVKKIGKLKADLSSVPNSEFATLLITPQGKILAAEFIIEMSVGSAELTFNLIYNGVSYGSTPIDY